GPSSVTAVVHASAVSGVRGPAAGAGGVLHLAARIGGPASWRVAEHDDGAERVNVGLARDLVEALRRDRRERPPAVLFAGTAMQRGPSRSARLGGGEPDEPVDPYARQKLAAELILKEASGEGVLRGVSLRLSTVYGDGPGGAGRGVVAAMARRALARRPLTVWHDGSVRRDLVHVRDIARAFTAALDHADAPAGRHWLVGAGRSLPLREIFAEIAGAAAARNRRPPVPVESVRPPDHAMTADFHDMEIAPSAFRRATGWRPRIALREGLARTVAALAEDPSVDCRAVQLVLTRGRPGEVYHVGGQELTNKELTGRLLELCGAGWERVRFVTDRKGHDLRYSVDDSKTRRELGYAPAIGLDQGLPEVVRWYRENRCWWNGLRDSVGSV
ncbi:NAD-dependent epimerase/dehydratase family protein, partial [Actinomadura kijaniata]|uniref:NAD-dependent epimerase/dehydratase family protein n=1 Tax=Actinomadura kijaniata TaxID=46161 RepID=UPI0031D5B9C8